MLRRHVSSESMRRYNIKCIGSDIVVPNDLDWQKLLYYRPLLLEYIIEIYRVFIKKLCT